MGWINSICMSIPNSLCSLGETKAALGPTITKLNTQT